jgi:hypothetical protein
MTNATATKTTVKTTAKKSVAKKSVAKKTPAVKTPVTKKPVVNKTLVTPRKTDDELKALAQKLWDAGVTSGPFAMSKATRGTADFVLSRRFIEIAKTVIAENGGAVRATKKSSVKSTGSLDIVEAMKREHAALKAWKSGGMKGDSPATPTLDKRNAELKAKADATKKSLATKKAVATAKKAVAK